MRTGTQIIGKSKLLTAKDLIKILKRVPEDTQIMVPSHMSAGYYCIRTDSVEFDDEKVHIGN
jgi:hypothetical protein